MDKNTEAKNNQSRQNKQTTTDNNEHGVNTIKITERRHEEKTLTNQKKNNKEQHPHRTNGKGRDTDDGTLREEQHNSEAAMDKSGGDFESDRDDSRKGTKDTTNNAMESYLGEFCKIPRGMGRKDNKQTQNMQKVRKICDAQKKPNGR